MYRYDFITITIISLLAHAKGKNIVKDSLEFWLTPSSSEVKSKNVTETKITLPYFKFREEYPNEEFRSNTGSNSIFEVTRNELQSILYELRKTRRSYKMLDVDSNDRYSTAEELDNVLINHDLRRHLGHKHGPNHKVKTHKIKPTARKTTKPMKSVNKAPWLRADEDVDDKYEETRKVQKKKSIAKGHRGLRNQTTANSNVTKKPLRVAENEPGVSKKDTDDGKKDVENISLSPYNILRHLQEIVVPKLQGVNITLEVLDHTVEYNNIVLMKAVSTDAKYFRADKSKYSDEIPEKKIIFIVHGLSCMGFTSLRCLYKSESFLKLLSYYFKHLDKFDIFLIPMANPDGVSMSYGKSFWNKNASIQKACPGVALDRNFDVAWNDSHSVNTCSQNYPGPTPFSEAESSAVRDVFHKYSHKIIAYFHVHAGTYNMDTNKGDAVLYPKGYTESTTDDDKYIDLRGEIEETVKNATFKIYSVSVDTIYNWYGKVFGTSVDYASTVYGIPYAMELVMQLYTDNMMVEKSEERESNTALTELWARVINTIFESIHKSLDKPEE